MRILKYLYYKFYKVMKIIDTDKIPEWKAYFLFSALLMTNIWVFAKVINKYVYAFSILDIVKNKISYFIIFTIVFSLTYLVFMKDKKYLEIERIFSDETNTKRIIGNIGLFIYVMVSIILIFAIWINTKI
jgi:hypothetical protein